MPNLPDLRERRRRETAWMLQKVTTQLVREQGFEAVTTDAIARAAGVSKRTFFNYYPNKEAAFFGEIPELDREDVDAFLTDEGPSPEALRRLMWTHTMNARDRGDELRLIIQLLATQPRVLEIYMAQREIITRSLACILARKYPGGSDLYLHLLAHSLLTMSWSSIQRWLEEGVPLERSYDEAWQALSAVSKLILGQS